MKRYLARVRQLWMTACGFRRALIVPALLSVRSLFASHPTISELQLGGEDHRAVEELYWQQDVRNGRALARNPEMELRRERLEVTGRRDAVAGAF